MRQAERVVIGGTPSGDGASRRRRLLGVVGVAVAVGIGLLVRPISADAQPQLPPVSPDELVRSVLAAPRAPFAGKVEVSNALGLPELPGFPQAANGRSAARVWSDGTGAGRIQLPTDGGERTLVSDGRTFWAWNSADRTVVTGPRPARPTDIPGAGDPTAAADEALTRLNGSSRVSVDGSVEVAGRPAYELVLTPLPTERTLLREVRIAVDAQQRVPLRVSELGNGSPDPALQIGFTELTFGPQDPALFGFTPPPGATVEQRPARGQGSGPDADRTVVGEGWDRVVIRKRPATAPAERREGAPDLDALGTPVSGPWGRGRVITSAIGSAIITDDGRIASGAVPQQILEEALRR